MNVQGERILSRFSCTKHHVDIRRHTMKNKLVKRILSVACVLLILGTHLPQGNLSEEVDAQDITEITPVYLPGFKHITTSDFADSEGSVMPSQTYNSTASFYMAERDSFDKTLLSLKLKYLSGGSDDRIEMAGTTNNSGFILHPNSTGTHLWFTVLVWDENAMVASPGNYFQIAFSATEAGVNSFINNEFIFQLSFEYGEFNGDNQSDDMRLGFYINGKRCQDTGGNSQIIIPGCRFEKFGDCLTVGKHDQDITVESVVLQAPKVQPVYLEGFRNITTSSFVDGTGYQMENKRYEVSTSFFMKDMQGNTNGSFDRTLLSLKLQYEVGSNASRIEMAGKDASSAFMLYSNAAGTQLVFTLSNWSSSLAHGDAFPIRLYAEQAGVYNFLNEEITFQMSMEYGNYDTDDFADDMKVGFYINGKLYENQHNYIYDCNFDTLFGDCLTVCTDTGAITVGTVVPVKEEVTQLAWTDYVKAGTQVKAVDQLLLVSDVPNIYQLQNQEIVNMANTSFEAKITFEKSGFGNEIRFAGAHTEYGIFILVGNDGNLWLSTSSGISPDLGLTDVLVFDKNVAGVETFLNKEFTFKITTEFDDYDGDGNANDVQLGFYINGCLYNNQYLYGYNCRESFGPYLSVYSQSGSVLIRSITDDYELKVWNLYAKGSAYEIETPEEGTVYIDGKVSKETSLSVPGDYLLQVGEDAPTQKIVVYSERDAHPDDILDIRDLVATVKGSQGASLDTWAGNLGVQEAGANTAAVRERLLSSMDTQESNAVDFEFIGEDVMPIAGFNGPHRSYDDEGRGNTEIVFENFLTEDWMKVISESGINLIAYTDANYASKDWPDEVNKLLEWGGKYGVGLFVSDAEVTKPAYFSEDAVIPVNTLRERIQEYSIYDAFCGLFVVDEPNTEYYPTKADGSYYNPEVDVKKPFIFQCGNLANVLQHDLNIPCYLNMYGYWKNKNQQTTDYEKYVEEFCQTLQPNILMWDRYPFNENKANDEYFYSMDVVRRNAQKNKIPFWAAIQAGGYFNDADNRNEIVTETHYPNQNQFNWNVNTCLAYGVQGLDYFPLIQPVHFAYEPNNEFDFERSGLIGANGFNMDENGEQKLNQWYYYAQDINKHIKAMDHVLMNSVCQGLMLNVEEAGEKVGDNNRTKVGVNNFLSDFASVDKDYILGEGSDKLFSVTEKVHSFILGLTYTTYEQNDPVDDPASWREVVDVTGNAMIGCFNYHGKTALYVVNYNTVDVASDTEQQITITLDNTYHVKKTQNSQTSCIQEQEITLDMKAGEGVLLVIE